MKRFVFSAMLVLCAAPLALGGATVTLHNGYGNSPGGEFDVEITAGLLSYMFDSTIPLATNTPVPSGALFATFCIEKSEAILFGVPYTTSVEAWAIGGGKGNGGAPVGTDPISEQTGYLYSNFARQTLAGYTYGILPTNANRVISATALQQALWYLENEEPAAGGATPYDYAPTALGADIYFGAGTAAAGFVNLAFLNAPAGSGNFFGVRALNLWEGTKAMQSQLILIPVPAAVVLGGLGIGFIGWWMRKSS